MRLVRWATPGGPTAGVVDGDVVHPIASSIVTTATRVVADPQWRPQPIGDPVPLDELALLAPIEPTTAVRDFYAFERHVKTARARRGLEMEPGWYERPVFYFSNPSSMLGPDAEVHAPARSHELDFELELAWVVGTD